MLSIIIPTLNEEKYLPLLLGSIKNQDFSDYEIIVADAGSKDKTIEIAKNFGAKIVKGGLLSYGRNRGAEAASGETFLFLDSDLVLVHREFLKNALVKMKQRNLSLAVFPLIPINGKNIDKFAHFFWNNWSLFTQRWFPHGASAFLVDKKIHQKIGGFDETLLFVEDQPYVAAVSKAARFGIIREEPVFVSTRRYVRDGRLNVYAKYFLADFYLFFIGPIKSNIFNYKFGHYDEKK
jgi:glycosyltransferase involved in cell wall biosynthesis